MGTEASCSLDRRDCAQISGVSSAIAFVVLLVAAWRTGENGWLILAGVLGFALILNAIMVFLLPATPTPRGQPLPERADAR